MYFSKTELVEVDIKNKCHLEFLFKLLLERKDFESISHVEMPTYAKHKKFVKSEPYKKWFILVDDEIEPLGSCYITKQNEVGVFVLKKHRRKGLGKKTISWLIHNFLDETLLANINPKNKKSITLFEKLGFKHIQNTYRLTL